MSTPRLEIYLSGEDINPSRLKAKDLANLLASLDKMISDYVVRENPEYTQEEVFLGLQQINEGSVDLLFVPSSEEIVFAAIREIANYINQQDFIRLPKKTKEYIKEFRKVVVNNGLKADLFINDGRREKLTTIDHNLVLPKQQLLQGDVTLYGVIEKTGGKTPKVHIRPFNQSRVVVCDASKRISKIAGERLYHEVGVYGIGQWDMATMQMEEFTITSFTDFEGGDPVSLFKEISEEFGDAFDSIEDPIAYFAELRNDHW
ncbi:hypothetical protein [Picosynechococcus sp. PCC 8807]|uniref:hypothetical protein n=1 Tax=Picosynechococcus sp. PCC 8807 TaxID=195248 RepID=UPI0008109188|nr:hypothetical protein [Picosynechococcus sp. PCC 8807]ANV90786.1 hypothetical protein AWQ24_09160 [Picosynechococcus sp. PCC 8807]